jgi:drug/metabolite transporter (DMT)-like permease
VALYLVPLYAGLAAWVVLGEPLGWHHLGGAALILPGVLLVTRVPAPQPPGPGGRLS